MSIKTTLLKQIDNFVNELCIIFPKSKDILLLSEKYYLIKNVNSNLIIEYFVLYTVFKSRSWWY
jgi:hypothetical protein